MAAYDPDRPRVERLSELLMVKQEQMDGLQELRQELLNIRLGPADGAAKKCLRDLADTVLKLERGIREATDHITFEKFNALRKKNPKKAEDVADDVMEEVEEAQEEFGENFHAPQDCMFK